MLSASDQVLVQELKSRLREVAAERFQSCIVYGSRALGCGGPDSDLDVLVTVANLTPELADALQEAAYQVMWEHDFTPLISLQVLDVKDFAAYHDQGFSFYRKVAREGISV
jgi:predicted nucleotidyltransferase